jgi:trimeric autotransporter adhesin
LISIRKAGAAALASTLMLVLPGTALANGGDHDGQRFDRGGRGFGGVPSRIANKLRSAERAMDRAQDHADDAEPDAAVAALAAVQRHLTSAQKSVARRVAAGNAGGPAAAAALARTQGNVVDGAIGLFDGAPDPIVTADAATLKAALDGRDALLAAIAALPDHSGYAWALKTILQDATSEAQDIAEALTDDTLTDAAKAALTAAATQVAATATAAQAAGASASTTSQSGTPGTQDVADDGQGDRSRRDCPPGGGATQSEAAPAAA